jgi:hypothetical protein
MNPHQFTNSTKGEPYSPTERTGRGWPDTFRCHSNRCIAQIRLKETLQGARPQRPATLAHPPRPREGRHRNGS